MHIDPHAWIVVLPLAVGLVQARSLPEDHPFKRFIADTRQVDALVMSRLRGRAFGASPHPLADWGFWLAIIALALSGLASLGAYGGWL